MWVVRQKLRIGGSRAPNGGGMELFPVISEEDAERGVAQPRRLFEHRLKYWRKVARRGIDDPEHFGGRRLLVERLARLGDEPRVLNRDDGLCREVLQECDLLIGERSD